MPVFFCGVDTISITSKQKKTHVQCTRRHRRTLTIEGLTIDRRRLTIEGLTIDRRPLTIEGLTIFE
jgi:hypothetical protein